MPPRWNENRLTAKLGIDYPVIQGPLGGLSSHKFIANGFDVRERIAAITSLIIYLHRRIGFFDLIGRGRF
jgi:hypothetical protein